MSCQSVTCFPHLGYSPSHAELCLKEIATVPYTSSKLNLLWSCVLLYNSGEFLEMCGGGEVPGKVWRTGCWNKVHLAFGSGRYGCVAIRALDLVGLNVWRTQHLCLSSTTLTTPFSSLYWASTVYLALTKGIEMDEMWAPALSVS